MIDLLIFLIKLECFFVGKFGAKLIEELSVNVKDVRLSGRSVDFFDAGFNEGLLLESHQSFTLKR